MIRRCLQALHTEQTITAPYGSDLTLNTGSQFQMIVETAAFAFRCNGNAQTFESVTTFESDSGQQKSTLTFDEGRED